MVSFRPVPMDREPARSLELAMREEMAVVYEGLDLDSPEMPKAGPAELGPPIAPTLMFAPAPPPAWPGPASAGPAKAIAAVATDAVKILRIMTISPQFRKNCGGTP